MKITMLKDHFGSNDGVNIVRFIEGQTYQSPSQISEHVINGFLKAKVAEIVDDKPLLVQKQGIDLGKISGNQEIIDTYPKKAPKKR